ncbi:DUF427 domain-containing protein [Roseovarius sp. M141]|uniref:DUF427 domain-containing protein n=1 Tax=Roseovarius sp. M141 TaxID=2583806 RepID=UPI0020CFA3DE|nr:DUF427 domain-containing protein [Roseovarius sp. M141]MCQ0093626.1 DUF427 domain-containing protein [Roseovarius sp. M141]
MTDITIDQATGTWTVRAGGAVIGESQHALELTEDGRPPVIYFPRADIATAFLDPSAHSTVCPAKGTASYFSIVTKSRTIQDAAWCYEAPNAEMDQIKGHLAFHTGDLVTVERV